MATTGEDNINLLFDDFMRELGSDIKEADEQGRILEKLQTLLDSNVALNRTRNAINRRGVFSAPRSSVAVRSQSEETENNKIQNYFKGELNLANASENTLGSLRKLYKNIERHLNNIPDLNKKISERLKTLQAASASSTPVQSVELHRAFQSGLNRKFDNEDNLAQGPKTAEELRANLPGVPATTKEHLVSLLNTLLASEREIARLESLATRTTSEWDDETITKTPEIERKEAATKKLKDEYNQAYRAALATVPASIATDRKPSQERLTLIKMSLDLSTSLRDLKTVQLRAKEKDLEFMADRHRKAATALVTQETIDANAAEYTALSTEIDPLRREVGAFNQDRLLQEDLEEKNIIIRKTFLDKASRLSSAAKTNKEETIIAEECLGYSKAFFDALDLYKSDVENQYTEDKKDALENILTDYRSKCSKATTAEELENASLMLTNLLAPSSSLAAEDSDDEDEDAKIHGESRARSRSDSVSSTMSSSFTMTGSTVLLQNIFEAASENDRVALDNLNTHYTSLFTDQGNQMPGFKLIQKVMPVLYSADQSPNKEKTKALTALLEAMTLEARRQFASSLDGLRQADGIYFFSLYQQMVEPYRKLFLNQWSELRLVQKETLLKISHNINDQDPQKRVMLFTLLSTVSKEDMTPIIGCLQKIVEQSLDEESELESDTLDNVLQGNLNPDANQDGHVIMRIIANIHKLALAVEQVRDYQNNIIDLRTAPIPHLSDAQNELGFHKKNIMTACVTLNQLLGNPSLKRYVTEHPDAKKALVNIIQVNLEIDEIPDVDNFTFDTVQKEYTNAITSMTEQIQHRLEEDKKQKEDVKRTLDTPSAVPANSVSITPTPNAASALSTSTAAPSTHGTVTRAPRRSKIHDFISMSPLSPTSSAAAAALSARPDAAPNTPPSATSDVKNDAKRPSSPPSPADSKLATGTTLEQDSSRLLLRTLEADKERLQVELHNTTRESTYEINQLKDTLREEQAKHALAKRQLTQVQRDLANMTSTPGVKEVELTRQMETERRRIAIKILIKKHSIRAL